MDEPLTPATIEAKVIAGTNRVFHAQVEFAKARDAKTSAEIEFKRARVTSAASENCPSPARGGVTVAERDAWLDTETFSEWEALMRAESALDICNSAVRVNRDILSGLQTVARSVAEAYRNAS